LEVVVVWGAPETAKAPDFYFCKVNSIILTAMGSIGDRYLYNESIERGLWSFETSLKKLIARTSLATPTKRPRSVLEISRACLNPHRHNDIAIPARFIAQRTQLTG